MRGAGQFARVVLVLTALVAAVVLTRWIPSPEEGTSSPGQRPTSSSSPTAASSASQPTPDRPTSADAWQKTARSFIARYGVTKGGKAAWLKRLRPVVSDDVYAGLRTVRLSNLPTGSLGAGEVLSRAEIGGVMRFPLRGGSIGGVDVTVSVTDEGTLRVTGFSPVPGYEVS